MKKTMKLLGLILLVLSVPLFGNAVATITALRGDVTIQNGDIKTKALLGAKLQEENSVITADKSKAQMIFKDETIVTIGKNSYFSIQKYINDKNHPEVEFHLVKGVMRTITGRIGKIAPSKFKVHTKTATIGIRGTNFTIVAGQDGVRAYCTYGAISVSYKNTTQIVKQGFYANIMKKGKIELKKFSAKDLKALEKKNFGVSGTVTEKEKISKEVTPDTLVDAKEQMDEVVVLDVTDDVKDAVFTAEDKEGKRLHGYSVDRDYLTEMESVTNLVFQEQEESALFEKEFSYVEVIHQLNDENSFDKWTFYLQKRPESFDSEDHFVTSFGSVKLEAGSESTSRNPNIVTSNFKTFDDDPAGDYMSWGEWNAVVTYEHDSPVSEEERASETVESKKVFKGLWIAGSPTDTSVIQAMSGDEMYSGSYKVMNLNNGNLDDGVAFLHVDFGRDMVTLKIDKSTNQMLRNDYQFDGMEIKGNSFSTPTVSETDGFTQHANGTFYGPNGEAIGGNFLIKDGSSTNVKGIYQTSLVKQAE